MDRYVCPRCRKQLTEDDVVRCVCSSCHSLFDKPDIGGKTKWKSLKAEMRAGYGEHIWTIGNWHELNAGLQLLEKDFFVFERVIDAMQDVPMEVLAQVEVGGEQFQKDNKECWKKIQIVNAWGWEKKHNVALAIFAATLTIHNYEQKYPAGNVPHKAIEVAKKWLDNPTEENRLAAQMIGSDTWSAAESAARMVPLSTSRSVWSAAEKSAELAIRSAAQSAWSAAETSGLSAKAAAEAVFLSAKASSESMEAASGEVLQQCEDWIQKHIAELKEFNK